MSKITHLVLKHEDIQKALPDNNLRQFNESVKMIRDYRAATGKNPDPNYYICNQDEKYSDQVLEVIKAGEGEFSPVYTVTFYFALELEGGIPALVKAEYSDCTIPFTSVYFNEVKKEILKGYQDEKGRKALKIVTISQKEFYENTQKNASEKERVCLIKECQPVEFDRQAMKR